MLNIGKDYALETDEMNVTLLKKRVVKTGKNVGDVQWDAVGYYGTLGGALEGLIDRKVQTNGLADLKTIVQSIHDVKRDVLEFKKVYAVDMRNITASIREIKG